MDNISEIKKLEEQLRLAELGPDPKFFETYLADHAFLDGQQLKAKVVEAHRPGSMHKFTQVEMGDFEFVDHGHAVVVLCTGHYLGPKWSGSMRFMRVWLKTRERWQIISGTTTMLPAAPPST